MHTEYYVFLIASMLDAGLPGLTTNMTIATSYTVFSSSK